MSAFKHIQAVGHDAVNSVASTCEGLTEAVCNAIDTLCEDAATLEEAQAIIAQAKNTLQAAKL